ncbi:MAG: site-2 protease family protein [Clostridia bacterium]|nr:site-2 protease family protein [Clostridia bacterium]
MSTALSIVIAIFVFGLLIFVHEGGHYVAARLCGVTVKEFAIGMGPKLASWVSKKTNIRYSLRLLPFGGFTSMEGEEEESDDPHAFGKQSVWRRIIIIAAGPLTNIVLGIIIMSLLVIFTDTLGSTTIHSFIDDTEVIDEMSDGETDTDTEATGSLSEKTGLMVGDTIIAVDGESVHTANELSYEVMRRGIEPVDITVIRDGETVVVEDVEFPVTSSSGVAFGSLDFYVYAEEKTVLNVIKHAFWRSELTIEMVWESLYDLITGRYGVEAVSGPVGVTETLGEAASTGISNLVYIAVVLSINLGVMNLLPIPALDGGHLVFMIIEILRGGKKIKPDTEAMINFAGLCILMIFMVVVTCKDIASLFG